MNVKWIEWEKRVIGELMTVWRSGRNKTVIGEVMTVWRSGGKKTMIGEVMTVRRSGRRGWVGDALKCERERVRLVWCVWERRWVREYYQWGVNFKKIPLFGTESLRLGFQVIHMVHHVTARSRRGRHVGNRVSKTQFLRGVHVDLLPGQVLSKHVNRVLKTRFIGPKSSL